jgi:serine/threonine-protein kinase
MPEKSAPGARLAGRYQLGARLGRGGSGEVLAALDLKLGRVVAVKRLRAAPRGDRATQQRLVAEARLLAAIEHPNVVKVLDVDHDHQGQPFFVMELLRGATLRELLRTAGRLAPARAVRLVVQLLDGLRALHDVGVLHGDLTASNVIVVWTPDAATPDEREQVKLVDVGAAAPVSPAGLGEDLRVVGTAEFLAPELLRGGDAAASVASDLYAAGVVLHWLLLGRSPWHGCTGRELLQRKVAHAPLCTEERAWRGIPTELRSLVERSLAVQPEARFASAAALAAALRGCCLGATSTGPSARALGLVSALGPASRRWASPSAVAAGLFVAAWTGAGLFLPAEVPSAPAPGPAAAPPVGTPTALASSSPRPRARGAAVGGGGSVRSARRRAKLRSDGGRRDVASPGRGEGAPGWTAEAVLPSTGGRSVRGATAGPWTAAPSTFDAVGGALSPPGPRRSVAVVAAAPVAPNRPRRPEAPVAPDTFVVLE